MWRNVYLTRRGEWIVGDMYFTSKNTAVLCRMSGHRCVGTAFYRDAR